MQKIVKTAIKWRFASVFVLLLLLSAVPSGAVVRNAYTALRPMVSLSGLSVAFDAETGFEQIFYRQNLYRLSGIRLTDSPSDKSLPKWGPKALDYYYFFDAVNSRLLDCADGDLFYYLADENSGMNLNMGCVAGLSTADETIIADYRLTGFSETQDMNVDDYCMAQGTNLVFSYEDTLHEAFPVIVELDTGERLLILLDDEAHVGDESYAYGYVTYYTPGESPGQWFPLNDGYHWDGELDENDCFEEDGPVASEEEIPEEDDSASGTNDDTDESATTCPVCADNPDPTSCCVCSGDGSTLINSDSQSSSTASGSATAETLAAASSTASSSNTNSTSNTNTATQTLGDITITNENYIDITITGNDAAGVVGDEAVDSAPTPAISEDVSGAVDEVTFPGGFHLTGGGGCSLTTLAPADDPYGFGIISFAALLCLGVVRLIRNMPRLRGRNTPARPSG